MRFLMLAIALTFTFEAQAQWYMFWRTPVRPNFAPKDMIRTLRDINQRHQRDLQRLQKEQETLPQNSPKRPENEKEMRHLREHIRRNQESIDKYTLA